MAVDEKTLKYLTLEGVVMDYLNDRGIYNLRNYKRYLQWAIRGFTSLSIFNLNTIEVRYLEVSEAGTVVLPDDYIDYTKIGYMLGDSIWTLGLNNNLGLVRDEQVAGGDFDTIKTAGTESAYFVPHWHMGLYVPALYGAGGGANRAFYRIDKEEGVIQLEGTIPIGDGHSSGYLVLEYISSGVSLVGTTFIPKQAWEAMNTFLHWKEAENADPHVQVTIDYWAKRHSNELVQLNAFEDNFTPDELMDVIRSGYGQGAKR